MAVQLSEAVRNARLDAIETTIGASAFLDIRTGAQPANCGLADAGTELAHIALPADYFAAAAGGSKAKLGTWQGTGVGGGGTAGHFRIKNNADTVCHVQGSITATSGGGDMELDNVVIADGQTITVTTFTITDANS